jgi:glutaredoxin
MEKTKLKAHVVIYSKPGCHLCDEAKETIEAAGSAVEYSLEVVNIEDQQSLMEKYKNDIPVITINGEEAFRHRVDLKKFIEAVARTKTNGK